MKRLILFSHVLESVLDTVLPLIFPASLDQKVFACMPCDGSQLYGKRADLFVASWSALAQEHHAEFVLINNASKNVEEERNALLRANILLITGGNVCALLRNLRRSGLNQAILDFARKDHSIIAGYSAGAMILTPSVQLAARDPSSQENEGIGLTDFTALHLVDFEIFPHYEESKAAFLAWYQSLTPYEVKLLRDEEYLLIERE